MRLACNLATEGLATRASPYLVGHTPRVPCAFENGTGGATGLRSPFENALPPLAVGDRSVDFEKGSGDASVAL